MADGTRTFVIPAQQDNHIKAAEISTGQNYNMINGIMNNAPSMEELEAKAKAGEQISFLDVAKVAGAETKKPKQTRKTAQKPEKPSIRVQLAAAKEEQKEKPPAWEKSKKMEVWRMYFTVGEENLFCLYRNAKHRRAAANLRTVLSDMDREMAILVRQTADKLDAMNDADFVAQRFHFTDE